MNISFNFKERRILEVLQEISDRRGPENVFPGIAYLARRAKCGERTASRAIAILKAAGAVEQIARGRRSCLYILAVENPFGGAVAGQAWQSQVISIQAGRSDFGGASGGATPFINTPPTPSTEAEPSPESETLTLEGDSNSHPPIRLKESKSVQPPAFLRTPAEIKLWKLALEYLKENRQFHSERPWHARVAIAMHALEESGAMLLPEVREASEELLRKPVKKQNRDRIEILRRSLGE